MKRTICALMALALCCGAAAGEIVLWDDGKVYSSHEM